MRFKSTFSVKHSHLTLVAFCAGALLAFFSAPAIETGAQVISDIFMRLLRLVSIPIIFLSLLVTISKVGQNKQTGQVFGSIVKYTLLTTLLAAIVALVLYSLLDPALSIANDVTSLQAANTNYWEHLIAIIPSTFMSPFLESNVMGVLVLALGLGFAMTQLKEEQRLLLSHFFDACLQTIMVVTRWIVRLLPIAVFAFSYLFVKDLKGGLALGSIGLYLLAVVGANLLQGAFVLPILMMAKGISPSRVLAAMFPALCLAFFSKSSAGTIPLAIQCAEERLGISPSVARFSFPVCTTINMNACAGFILITVLFVSQSNGVVFSSIDMLSWVVIATIAAVGNAGVPMGCYFLTSALLTTMNVPLNLLGVILPFYAVIDMFETAINVWSDSCVTAIAAKEMDVRSETLIVELS